MLLAIYRNRGLDQLCSCVEKEARGWHEVVLVLGVGGCMRAEGDAIEHHASVHKGCVCVDIRESGEGRRVDEDGS